MQIPVTLFVAAALTLPAAAPALASQPHRSIPAANPAALGSQPNVVIHDRVLPRRSGAHSAAVSDVIPANAFSGSYTANGIKIKIAISPSYPANAAIAQSWADFLASLPQRGDAATMTAYFAPRREMQRACGPGADACYDSNDSLLILPGEPAPDGASAEEVAAHEFGHHIANHRSNSPWSADSWGPKRWATKLKVCQGVRARTMFPDDQDGNYDRNPTEGWAEAYRVSAGQNPTDWSIVSDIFRPNAATQKIALLDATSPWPGNVAKTVSGSFKARAAAVKRIKLSVPLDGRVSVSASTGGMKVALDLFDATDRKRLASSAAASRASSLRSDVCGQRTVVVHLKRSAGSGSYKLTTSLPAP